MCQTFQLPARRRQRPSAGRTHYPEEIRAAAQEQCLDPDDSFDFFAFRDGSLLEFVSAAEAVAFHADDLRSRGCGGQRPQPMSVALGPRSARFPAAMPRVESKLAHCPSV